MANPIKPKRSYTPSSVPTTSDLQTHELALNWNDGKVFTKDAAGNIVTWTLGSGGGGGGSGEDSLLRSLFLPPAPTGVTASVGNAQAVVSWAAPSVLAQTPITDYIVQYQSQGAQSAGDSLWSSVRLLLALDENFADAATGSTTTFTALGGAVIDASTKKFGAGALPVGGFPAGYGISTTTAPTIGSGDLTLEWWQNFASVGSVNNVLMSWNTANFNTAWFQVRSTGTQWAFEATRYDSIDETYRTTQLLFANPTGWAHVAIVRQSGTWRVYIDGVQSASAAENNQGQSASGLTGPLSIPGGNVAFGRAYGGSGGTYAAPGHLDDIRLTLAARYPSGTAFTPPTAAHPTSAPVASGPGEWTTFSDGVSSGTSATVTGLTNGTAYTFRVAAVNAIGQGEWSAASSAVTLATDPYFSSVSLLMHMDGSGGTFVDSSSNARAVTAYGNATQSAAHSKFGGKSAHFDGSGDYLSLGENAAFTQWGNENWTVELWFRAASVSAYGPLFSASGRMNLHILSQKIYLNNAVDGVGGILTSEVLSANTWHHVVAVRSGSTCSLYVDGTLAASGDVPFGTGPGALNIGGDASSSFSGYIDEVRHTRGVARYTGSTITVPTAAFPDA